MYYYLLLWTICISFLAAVPLILAVRARQPGRMRWWLVFFLAAALGWVASNAYAYLEHEQIRAAGEDYSREGALVEFWQVTDPSVTRHWGWITGLVHLLICAGPYRLFRADVNQRISRPLTGHLAVAVALAILVTCPPWNTFKINIPFGFVVLYSTFLLCAGLSYHVLRIFRLQHAGYPFVVMFLVTLLLFIALLFSMPNPPDLWSQIQHTAHWAALFGAVFTAFWWMAIRPGRAQPGQVP